MGSTATRDAGRRWAALSVALLGALESAWLSWRGASPLPCSSSTAADCAALLHGAGSRLLGLPLALWGHGAYAAAALLALAALRGAPRTRARAAAGLAALGTAMGLFSLFLVTRMVAERVLCSACLASAGLSVALACLSFPRERSRVPWTMLPGAAGALALALLLAAGPRAAASPSPERASELAALARHLRDGGARLYGVWWCPDCHAQRELFGPAGGLLPYVECGLGEPAAGVDEFPTWELGGERRIGLCSIEELARWSGFAGESTGGPGPGGD